MFQKIGRRLLVNNIVVFVLVLGGSAIAVRLVFVRNLHQQLTNQLIVLAQGVIAEAEMENGRLTVEDEFLAQTLINPDQSFEWFDLNEKPIERMGEKFPEAPLDMQAGIELQDQVPPIQSITLPISAEVTRETIGYIRISQSFEEFDETVLLLDIGLGVGVLVATVFSAVGILWLNRQAMEPIEASFQRLKQFTADASHELRSPLMAISSNVEVALKYPEGMREEDREAMSAMLSATEQMTRLTEDLLLLARTDKTSATELVPLNLSDILKDLGQLYGPQAERKPVDLTLAVEPDLRTKGDASNLMRAFTNLLQNAIRYTPAGGHVSIDARQLRYQIQVKVQDTGVGIAEENLDKIFERFWRADRVRNYDDSGSGLGLAIAQAIIQDHKGSLEVSSTLGCGSCFTVTLPSS